MSFKLLGKVEISLSVILFNVDRNCIYGLMLIESLFLPPLLYFYHISLWSTVGSSTTSILINSIARITSISQGVLLACPI